jgi:hypothetical protein
LPGNGTLRRYRPRLDFIAEEPVGTVKPGFAAQIEALGGLVAGTPIVAADLADAAAMLDLVDALFSVSSASSTSSCPDKDWLA